MRFRSLSFLLLISSIIPAFVVADILSPPRTVTRINCGSTVSSAINDLEYLPDENFITAGVSRNIRIADLSSPLLSTVRSFPLAANKKWCYVVPSFVSAKYLVRTTFFYGDVNGPEFPLPPVFDQVIDGTLWSVVNTTDDYKRNESTYYEGVFMSKGKTISLCIGANNQTDSDPFISGVELVLLPNSVYNSTKFSTYGLSLVARHSFGNIGPSIRYPDDQFDRIWEPFVLNPSGSILNSTSTNMTPAVSGIWNLPPAKVFQTKLTSDLLEPLEFKWPSASLPTPNHSYYVALYFAGDSNSTSGGSAILNVKINDVAFYKNLNVTQEGVSVFSSNWSLGGATTVVFSRAAESLAAPFINAGEIFSVVTMGRKTLARDVMALEDIKASFTSPPIDWNGDPCLPRQYSWTGVTCSEESRVRVIGLNLTSMGLSGSLSASMSRLTALGDILLGSNNLSGSIPELSSLKLLKRLHLENNQLSGPIPSSLGDNNNLSELFLQNNNLSGQIPNNIYNKNSLNLKIEGNPQLFPPPS